MSLGDLLRLFGRRVRPHAGALGIVLALSLVGAIFSLAQPALVQQLITSIQEGATTGGPVTVLIAVVLGGAVLSAVTTYLLPRVGLDVVFRARTDLTSHLLRLPVAQLDTQRIGDLLSRVGADTTLLQTAIAGGVVQIVSGLVVAVGAFVAMAIVDAALLGLVVALLLVAIVIIGAATGQIRRLSAIEQAHIGDVGAETERALGAVRTVKAARAEARTAAAMAQAAARARDAGEQVVRIRALLAPAVTLATQGAFLAVLAVGGGRVASGTLEVADLVAFILYLFLLVLPVAQIAQAVAVIQSGLAALERIEQLLAFAPEDADDPQQTPPPAGGADRLTFDRVTFSRGELAVLREVSFSVPAGTRTALVGPSGAGKTTLLSLVERFADPDNGRILLDGVDLRELPRAALRARIGYVEQDAPALAGTLRENLTLADPDASDAALMEALRAVQLEGLVTRTEAGLEAEVGERGVRLSGGERQRLAIARALLAGPDLLLLDEPTANLDARNEQAMVEAIDAAAEHRTVLIVAHRLSTVVGADQIVVLDQGRVRAIGTHAELVERDELYAELSAVQFLS